MIGADAGIVVAPGDMEALADAMLRLARDADLRRQMGAAAKERYERLFSPKAVVPLMIETYRRVIQNAKQIPDTVSNNGNRHPWAAEISR